MIRRFAARWGVRFWNAVQHSTNRDADVFAACIAFYVYMWMLLAGIVFFATARSLVRESITEQDLRLELRNWIAAESSDETAAAFMNFIREGAQSDTAVIGFGMLGLLLVGATAFAWLERAFSRIFDLEYPASETWRQLLWRIVFYRLRAYVFVMALGFVGVVALALLFAWKQFLIRNGSAWGLSIFLPTQYAASLMFNWLLITLVFWQVPRTNVSFWHALRGALLCTIMWEICRIPIDIFVVTGKMSTFGMVGFLIASMLWLYYAIWIILFGCAYVRFLGDPLPPPTESSP
ncbi:YihY/virulence factor BrkB family protein [Blastopirellula sp. J2-11]|uniref:YihY/virulence factor BrkB family protein n=1 Tax=Blastopirellula sp. J2-11 TaxID=2943192 RepID=UPI0021C68242|nr:YhjD/YihY/BrkB family envelope integrity protein [Blastopirellula sp. J2-11]UUO06109.1 YihY/virulence factor BrkB family protein [Blastopirellula sp. J2-11]